MGGFLMEELTKMPEVVQEENDVIVFLYFCVKMVDNKIKN